MLEVECDTRAETGARSQLISTIGAQLTESQLGELLQEITADLKFDYFQYVGRFPIDQQKKIQRSLSNLPDAWQEKYTAAHYADIDPIARRAQAQLTPVIWRDLGALTPAERQFFDDSRANGIGDGVTFPVQARNGDVGMLSFASAVSRDDTDRLIRRSLAEGNLAAVFVHDAMRKLIGKERCGLQAPLKPRELECLRWIASGKTNWEISRILGVSEAGAVYYVRRLMAKLEVHNRQLLANRAITLGLL